MRIVSHREERMGDGTPWTVSFLNGPRDGEVFTYVIATDEDGEEHGCWTCNARPGYFKQEFVPADFDYSEALS